MRGQLLAAATALLASGSAHAGEIACWFEQGAVVIPAEVAGTPGDYILDTGAERTLLHDTRAQAAGIEATELLAEVRLAGVALPAQPVRVEALDARTYAFPTPIAGVIGADVLSQFVLDVSFAPCRVGLHRADAAPRLRGGRPIPMGRLGARPLVPAAVSDGSAAVAGPFILATGEPLAARLSEAAAGVPGAARPDELYAGGVWTAQLRALSFAGQLWESPAVGLMRREEAEHALGALGSPVLSRFAIRFDFPAGRIVLVQPSGDRPRRPAGRLNRSPP